MNFTSFPSEEADNVIIIPYFVEKTKALIIQSLCLFLLLYTTYSYFIIFSLIKYYNILRGGTL